MSVVNNYRIISVLPSEFYYGNSIITINNSTELINNFGYPTNDNYKFWFQVYNFLKYSYPIDVIRPVDANIKNSVLIFDSDPSEPSEPIINDFVDNFYNSSVADIDSVVVNDGCLNVIRKLPDSDDNLAIVFCSDLVSWKEFIYSGSTRRWYSYFSNMPKFNENEFACIILKKNSYNIWILAEKFIFSTDSEADHYINNAESEYVYFKGNNFVPFSTNQFTINDLKFIHSDDAQVESNDTIARRTLDIIKSEKYDIILDFAFTDDTNINRVSEVFENENIIIISGLWDETRYLNNLTRYDDIVNDFGIYASSPTGYFNRWSKNTIIIGNMKRQYDEFNDFYRLVPCFGDIAGLFSQNYDTPYLAGFNYGLIKHIEKLFFNPGENNNKYFLQNKINCIIYDVDYSGKFLYGDKTSEKYNDTFKKITNTINHYRIFNDLTTLLSSVSVKTTNIKEVERYPIIADKYLKGKKEKNIVADYSLETIINNNIITYRITLSYPVMIEKIILNLTYEEY